MKPNRLTNSKLCLALIGAVALTLSLTGKAEALLLAYDGFDYTAGQDLVGQSGGTGWAAGSSWDASNGTRLKINNGGLSYLNLVVSGNAVNNSTTSGVSGQRAFASAPTTGSVYFSFLVNGNATTFGRFGALLRPADGTVGPGALGQMTTDSLDGADGFSFRPDQATVGGINGFNLGGTSIVGTNLLVVLYNYDTSQASYWVNPTSLGGAAPTATVSGIGFTDPTKVIEQFFFEHWDTASTGTIFDEFRVGNTYASVTPVPEPSSALLIGLGAIGLLAPAPPPFELARL